VAGGGNAAGFWLRVRARAEISRAIFVAVTDDQPTLQATRPQPPARLGLSGKLLLLTISPGHDRRLDDLRPGDREISA